MPEIDSNLTSKTPAGLHGIIKTDHMAEIMYGFKNKHVAVKQS